MDVKMGMLALGIICAAALSIGFLKRRSEALLNFIVRTILGGVGIYMANFLLAAAGIHAAAGINPLSLLTVGSLGMGGFALIYGILIYNIL